MNIGPKIRELRLNAGLTQKNLADMLYVTYQAVSRWEKGDTEPSFDTLKKMCEVFNCSLDEIFEIDKSTFSKPTNDNQDKEVIDVDHKKEAKKRRIIGSLASLIILFGFVIGGAISFINSNFTLGIILCVLGLVLFFFTSTMVLNNSFVSELWHKVNAWSLLELNRILFKLNFNNKFFLVFTKIIFFILAIGFTIISFVVVTILCMLFSIFAYPSALRANIKSA